MEGHECKSFVVEVEEERVMADGLYELGSCGEYGQSELERERERWEG